MTATTLGRRLDGVQRIVSPEAPFRFVVILPESWPAAVMAAYEEAKDDGDRDRQADIVAAQTGSRPTMPRAGVGGSHRTPPIVEIRTRPDGPQ